MSYSGRMFHDAAIPCVERIGSSVELDIRTAECSTNRRTSERGLSVAALRRIGTEISLFHSSIASLNERYPVSKSSRTIEGLRCIVFEALNHFDKVSSFFLLILSYCLCLYR